MYDTKDKTITFRIERELRNAIQQKAGKNGLTIAGYLRYIIIQELKKGK